MSGATLGSEFVQHGLDILVRQLLESRQQLSGGFRVHFEPSCPCLIEFAFPRQVIRGRR